jgi:hypothetical protein
MQMEMSAPASNLNKILDCFSCLLLLSPQGAENLAVEKEMDLTKCSFGAGLLWDEFASAVYHPAGRGVPLCNGHSAAACSFNSR